jgi:Sec-independent protein translocase protein TatA
MGLAELVIILAIGLLVFKLPGMVRRGVGRAVRALRSVAARTVTREDRKAPTRPGPRA